MPMPARARRASRRWRSRRRLRASPGSAPVGSRRARATAAVRHARPRQGDCDPRPVPPARARLQSRAPPEIAPDRARAARRAPPRLRPCAAAPVPSLRIVALVALRARRGGLRRQARADLRQARHDVSGERRATAPNRIITVEAPPRLVLVVTGGPERLLARLGVRAAVAPADVTVARIAAAHPDLVVVGPGVHRAGRAAQRDASSASSTCPCS